MKVNTKASQYRNKNGINTPPTCNTPNTATLLSPELCQIDEDEEEEKNTPLDT